MRQDNADLRLTKWASGYGLVKGERLKRAKQKGADFKNALELAHKKNHEGLKINEWFRKPGNELNGLPKDLRSLFSDEAWGLVEIDCKNAGYIARQEQMIARTEKMESVSIPDDIEYNLINGLKKEAADRLTEIKPKTLGQASRVSGITPADIAVMTVWLSKNRSISD